MVPSLHRPRLSKPQRQILIANLSFELLFCCLFITFEIIGISSKAKMEETTSALAEHGDPSPPLQPNSSEHPDAHDSSLQQKSLEGRHAAAPEALDSSETVESSPDKKIDVLEENQTAEVETESTPNAVLDNPSELTADEKCTKNVTDQTEPVENFSVKHDGNSATERKEEERTVSEMKPKMTSEAMVPVQKKTRRITANQEDLVDAFDEFVPRRPLKKMMKVNAPSKPEARISIKLLHIVSAENEDEEIKNDSSTQLGLLQNQANEIWWDQKDDYYYHDDETFMEFYDETHEEQSEAYQKFLQQRKENEIRLELRKIEHQDREGRASIERIMAEQMEEKKQQADRNINKYIQRVEQEEKRDLQKLQGLYQQRLEANQQKVTNSMKILQRRQQKEMQVAAQSHQQRLQQQQIPEHIASVEWQNVLRQLQAKHQRQQQEFKKKADELKQKTDADYSREEQKIRTQHETKIKDAEKSRQKLAAKLVSHFQQVRQRYLKRHIQRIVNDRNDLTKGAEESKRVTNNDESEESKLGRLSMEGREEFNPPMPIKSQQPWLETSPYEPSGAASRHKHRKGVMSQTKRQLSVEIHNEGIWVSVMKTEEDDKRTGSSQPSSEHMATGSSAAREEFIPWGTQAFDFLESVVCGEIPTIFERTRSFRDTEAAQGGQVRCILSDLRVSEEVASFQRAVAAREREESGIEELEKKYNELNKLASEVERQASLAENEEKECRTVAESTAKEVAKARRCQDEFRTKFRNYLGPGKQHNLFCASKRTAH
jgi:hypothetical protein